MPRAADRAEERDRDAELEAEARRADLAKNVAQRLGRQVAGAAAQLLEIGGRLHRKERGAVTAEATDVPRELGAAIEGPDELHVDRRDLLS